MKAKVFMRIAPGGRKGYKVAATTTPNLYPLESSTGVPLPTAAFAVDFNVPDELFERAEQVLAEITLLAGQGEVAAEVRREVGT